MKFYAILFFVFFLFSCHSPEGESSESGKTETHSTDNLILVDYYGSEHKRGLNDIVADVIASGKKPVLFFTAEWCGPCQQFKNSLRDPLMKAALKDGQLILIEETTDSEKIVEKYGVHAFPTFIRVDKEGKNLKQTDGGAWNENIAMNIAPVMYQFLKD